MMLVTNTEALTERVSHAEAVKMIAAAGFDAIDLSFFDMKEENCAWRSNNWKNYAQELKDVAADCGVVFSQAHAPFPSAKGEQLYDSVVKEQIIRSMEVSAFLGVKNIVVHPIHYGSYFENRKERFQQSVDFYRELIPYCEEFNIRICTENMWERDPAQVIRHSLLAYPDEFKAILEELDSPWIGACLDIGHAALVGQDPAQMVLEMGKTITCLHVHDVDYIQDNHTLPFTQSLDWESITAALGGIDYRGDFTFEAGNFLVKMPTELWVDALKLMERVGRYLIGRIEANRPE